MLKVNKSLKANEIKGKKYRSPAFLISAIISIPFVALAFLISAVIPDRDGKVIIILLIFLIWLAIPISLLFNIRKVSYIIAEDKLYFFDSQVKRLNGENRKKDTYVRTSGSVDYSDIKDLYYLAVEIKGFPQKHYGQMRTITPPRVVIIGNDFEVEIYANKNLIKKIKQLYPFLVDEKHKNLN